MVTSCVVFFLYHLGCKTVEHTRRQKYINYEAYVVFGQLISLPFTEPTDWYDLGLFCILLLK